MAAGLVVLLGVAGRSSSTLLPQSQTADWSAAEVTGFAAVPVTSTSPSGTVTVRITGPAESRLALLVSQLPAIAQSQVVCHEPLGLMYRIVFGSGSAAPSEAVVDGYRCDAAVTITVAGKASLWGRDANCSLIRAVALLLPRQAKATQSLSIGCDS